MRDQGVGKGKGVSQPEDEKRVVVEVVALGKLKV